MHAGHVRNWEEEYSREGYDFYASMGNEITELLYGSHTTSASMICPVCGVRIASSDSDEGVFEFYNKNLRANGEYDPFDEGYIVKISHLFNETSASIIDDLSEDCDICETHKGENNDQRMYEITLNIEDVDCVFEYMHRKRWEYISKDIQSTIDELCNKYCKEARESNDLVRLSALEVENIKNDFPVLKGYIKNILEIENSIYILKQRLIRLHFYEYDFSIIKKGLEYDTEIVDDHHLNELKKRYDALMFDSKRSYSFSDFGMQELTAPTEPEKPSYEVSSFFNKKRIETRNNHLRELYEAEMEKYNRELAEFHKRETILHDELKTKIDEVRLSKNEEAKIIKSDIDLLQEQLKKKKRETLLAKCKVIEQNELEIKKVCKLLRDSIFVRQQYYESGVIAKQYQDYVVLCTLYDYLETERCRSLGGSDGAYNLYENESRQNMMIRQLSTVITQLEDIRGTQHKLYSQMISANNTSKTIIIILRELQNLRLK